MYANNSDKKNYFWYFCIDRSICFRPLDTGLPCPKATIGSKQVCSVDGTSAALREQHKERLGARS